MINFKMLATQLLEKFERLTPYERYKWFLSQYYLATFKLGKENFRQTDCSGILSGALYLAGFNIRCTSQFFYDHIFLMSAADWSATVEYLVCFVVDKKTGEVSHLLPHIENGIFLDVQAEVRFYESEAVNIHYETGDMKVRYRTTSEKTLSAFSVSLLAATEIDKEIAELLGV